MATEEINAVEAGPELYRLVAMVRANCEHYFPYDKTPGLGLCLVKHINANNDYGSDCERWAGKDFPGPAEAAK